MKHFNLKIAYFLMIGLFFISCQKEEIDIIDETPGEAITLDAPLTNLLLNTTQNNGGIDDFIDGTSCSSIQFPYQVIMNGQTITISNPSDLIPLANTTAPIAIVFPITVVFEDFSTLVVNSQQELDALGQVCQSLNEAIDCVELVYPITLFIFNSNNEQTGTVVINNNIDLFLFLSTLEPGVFVAINFPITVILADGTFVTVTSNSQLQDLIGGCEEIIPDPPNPLDLEAVLTTDSWYVSYFFDDEDETDDFAGYEFTFNNNGTATASNGSNTVPGSWSITNSSSGQLKLILDFGVDDPFDELEEDWKVIDFTNELIRLFDVSGGDGSTDYLSFSRTPTQGGGTGGGNPIVQELKDILIDGNWFIALYLEDGEDDETSDFNSFSFDFLENGLIIVSNSQVTLEGTWQVTINSNDNLKLILNFIDVFPLDELDDDWLVVEFQNNQINLLEDGDPDGDILIFEKL